MKIKKFNEFEPINEAALGGLIKGALGKLFNVFSAPFKDIAKDIKNAFKEEDPNSIKGIILTNFNQAVDDAQKQINDLKDDSEVLDIMNNMIKGLTDLGNNIGKDVSSAFGGEKKSDPIKEIAKAVILGNVEAKWSGIVGLIDFNSSLYKKDTNYKFSKKNYIDQVNKGKDLKEKKNISNKFLDSMQKDIKIQLDKEFTEDELKKIYSDAGKKVGLETMDYAKLKVFYDAKTPVMYKRLGYDESKKPEDQKDKVGVKNIDELNDQGEVKFKDNVGGIIVKKYSDILGPVEVKMGENAKKVSTSLGKIKSDEEKMGQIAKFADFLQDPTKADKIKDIEAVINK